MAAVVNVRLGAGGTTFEFGLVTGRAALGGEGNNFSKTESEENGSGVPPSSYLFSTTVS